MDCRTGCQRIRSCDHGADDAFPRLQRWLIRTHNRTHNRAHSRDKDTDKNKWCNARKSKSRLGDRAYCPQFSGPGSPKPDTLRLVTSRPEFAPGLPMPDRGEKGSGKFQGVRKFASRWWNSWRESTRWLRYRTSAPIEECEASHEKSYRPVLLSQLFQFLDSTVR